MIFLYINKIFNIISIVHYLVNEVTASILPIIVGISWNVIKLEFIDKSTQPSSMGIGNHWSATENLTKAEVVARINRTL